MGTGAQQPHVSLRTQFPRTHVSNSTELGSISNTTRNKQKFLTTLCVCSWAHIQVCMHTHGRPEVHASSIPFHLTLQDNYLTEPGARESARWHQQIPGVFLLLLPSIGITGVHQSILVFYSGTTGPKSAFMLVLQPFINHFG